MEIKIPNIDQLKKDPIVIEYIKRVLDAEKSGVLKLMSPIDALGEKRFVILGLSAGVFDKSIEERNLKEPATAMLAIAINSATVIYVTDEMNDLLLALTTKVREAYEKAGDQKPSPKPWPFDLMWFTGQSGFKFAGSSTAGVWDALLLNKHGHSLSFKPGFDDVSDCILVKTTGEIYPVVSDHAWADALAIFLEQKIARIEEQRPNRQFRKEARRLGLRHDETVRVITLRRLEKKSGGYESTEKTREYHCRWLVSGHLRNQWFPSRQRNELMWIDPHEKGPADMPFKEVVRYVSR